MTTQNPVQQIREAIGLLPHWTREQVQRSDMELISRDIVLQHLDSLLSAGFGESAVQEAVERLGNPRFLELLEETRETHVGKAAGYSGSDQPDTWANFREAIAWGLTPLQGCLVRMGDKYRRIQNLRRDPNNDRVGEPIRDTLMDLANYALIAVCLHEEEEQARLIGKAATVMEAVEPDRDLLPQLHPDDRTLTFRIGSAVEPCFSRGHIGGIHVHPSFSDEGHMTLAVKASGQTR